MKKIDKIWFTEKRIFMRDSDGKEFSRPLEAVPALKDAEDFKRAEYLLFDDGLAAYWPSVDEYLNVEFFLQKQEPVYDNPVGKLLQGITLHDYRELLSSLGWYKNKLDLLRYGICKANEESLETIRVNMDNLGLLKSGTH